MFKLVKYIYEMGRKQAYTEILSQLETLVVRLPRNREGQLLRQPVEETIKAIRLTVGDEEARK